MKRTLYFYFLHTPAFKDILNDQTGNLKHHSHLEYKKSTEPHKALSHAASASVFLQMLPQCSLDMSPEHV